MLRPNAKRVLLAAAWLAATALPLAAVAGPPPAALAALAAPRAGTVLVAGETAAIEWAPGPALAGARHVEEWEAFLSVDGGVHYALRITPHLDRGVRRASFRVPDLPTEDARILLRVGDERREMVVELPQRFAIVRPAGTALGPVLADEPPARSLRPGEPARPGEAGVSRWIEGSRQGGGAREVESSPPPGAQGVADPLEDHGSTDALAPEAAPDALPTRAVAARAAGPPPRTATRRGPSRAAPSAADILLLTRRRNE